MRVDHVAICAAVCVLAAGCASEPGGEAGGEAFQVLNADAGDQMVCRTQASTGTRMRERVCATAEQWEAYDRRGEEQAGLLRRATEAGAARAPAAAPPAGVAP